MPRTHNPPVPVLCCGARSWCTAIAWMQILANGFGAIVTLSALAGMSVLYQDPDSNDPANWGTSEEGFTPFKDFSQIANGCLIVLLACCTSLCFGVILLKGVQKNNESYLKMWVGYLSFSWTCSFIASFKNTEVTRNSAKLVVVSLIPCGFAVYVVYLLLVEIEKMKNPCQVDGQMHCHPEGGQSHCQGQIGCERQDLPPSYDTLYATELQKV